MQPTQIPLRVSAVVALLLLLLAGCGSGPSRSSSGSSTAAGPAAPQKVTGGLSGPAPASAKDAAGGGSSAGGAASAADVALVSATVVRTADLTVGVPDVRAAATRAADLAAGAGGHLESEQAGDAAGGTGASLVLRVPADRFDALLPSLAGLGTERSRTVGSTEVGDQLVDLRTRVAAQQASVDRVQGLYASAKDLSQVVQLEAELTRRMADLESLQARVADLQGRVELSTITLRLERSSTAASTHRRAAGFGAGLAAGVGALAGAGRVVAVVAGALLPFLPFLVLLAVVAWRLRARVHARPVAGPPAAA